MRSTISIPKYTESILKYQNAYVEYYFNSSIPYKQSTYRHIILDFLQGLSILLHQQKSISIYWTITITTFPRLCVCGSDRRLTLKSYPMCYIFITKSETHTMCKFTAPYAVQNHRNQRNETMLLLLVGEVEHVFHDQQKE